MLSAAKEEIVFPLAASLLSRKPHPAHQLPTALRHPGIRFAISNTATGLHQTLYDEGRRSRCTGKERDSESGLDYFGARFYGSALGRFTSPDPDVSLGLHLRDPQSWNAYAYARNNPLTYTDPTGESYKICDADGQNCTSKDDELSDADFDAQKQAAQANGEHFNNGQMYHYDSSGNRVNDGTYEQTDVDLPQGTAQQLRLAGDMAAQGVNLAAQGLRIFGYAVAAPAMVAAECGAGAPSCTGGNVAMAVIPELGPILGGATVLKVGKGLIQYERAGGLAQAAKDFDALQGAERTVGNVRVKTLSDGSTANVRAFSSEGRPTLEIQSASGKDIKVRYNP